MLTLALDPGKRACGVAMFLDRDLVRAAWVRCPGKSDGPRQWRNMACCVWDWAGAPFGTERGHRIVFEQPGAYGSDSPGRTLILQDLIGVAAWTCSMFPYAEYVRFRPREWKGTIEKQIMCARAYERLSPEEKTLVELPAPSFQHNVKDAIGIGLAFLGRLEKKRVIVRG